MLKKYYASGLWSAESDVAELRLWEGEDPLVYLCSDIDAIPKLALSDDEMMQILSFLGVATWVRMLQAYRDEVQMAEFNNIDPIFLRAQNEALRILVNKFSDYRRQHKLSYHIWPTTEHPCPKPE